MAEQNDHAKRQLTGKTNSPHHKTAHDKSKHGASGVNKAQNIFGVSDLRELLNKKRQGQDAKDDVVPKERAKANDPPPDPRYGYLRDPLRGDQPQSKETKTKNTDKKGKNKFPNADEKVDSRRQNLPNIKVELRVATGSRNCVVDDGSLIKPLIRASETSVLGKRSPEGHRSSASYDDKSGRRTNFNKKAHGKEYQRKRNPGDIASGPGFTERGPKGARDAVGGDNDDSVASLGQKLRETLVIESSKRGSDSRDERVSRAQPELV